MKRLALFLSLGLGINAYGQYSGSSLIKEMNWNADYSIELTLRNDSIYVLDVENLHHVAADNSTKFESFTYYQVGLSDQFIKKLKKKGVELGVDTLDTDTVDIPDTPLDKTLWSALHSYIGGGWIHFVNTLVYSMEYGYLNIRSPLMQRPESNWKPKPVTESYKRTKKWKYYAPVNQKNAIKEYKIRQENDELGDIEYVPQKFINLFLNTNNREYKKLLKNNNYYKIARIDMIKLLLGANYLSSVQIKYIKHMVLRAVMQYSRNRLPSVIIFDNYNAAVALTLEETGYKAEKIIFADTEKVSEDVLELRKKMIEGIIKNINEVNMELFQERLQRVYN
jgi:hypothetical protein